MNITYERYTDQWGGKIALNKIPFNLKDEMKQHMNDESYCFGWNGAKGLWWITDRADVIEKALNFLAEHDITVEGLEFDETLVEVSTNVTVAFSPPDKLSLKWDFQPNWKDINASMKSASAGNARWNNNSRAWTIPVATGMAVATAVRPHFAPLADAIEANEEVQASHNEVVQRVELSRAVETDIELPDVEPFTLMRPYQRVAPIMYATGERNRILIADEMGLGKSLQALGCVELAEHERVLIVCPAVVKHNWANEIEKWIGTHHRHEFASTFIIKGRTGAIDAMARFHIINYENLQYRAEHLMDIGYDCIIFDEVHRIKNPDTKTTKASLKIAKGVDGIIALSGTPITNRPYEFFTTLNMMLPATFDNKFMFAMKYCNARKVSIGYGKEAWDYSGASNITESADSSITPLNHILHDFMLRRSMDDPRIAGEMPDLVETIVSFDLDDKGVQSYKQVHNSWMEDWVNQQQQFGSTDAGWTLNMMSSLRHHAGRLKVDAAVEWATTYLENNDKPLVVFAHHRDVVERIAEAIDHHYDEGMNVRVITGETPHDERQIIIEEFQAGGSEFLICSTNAMREGVNLDCANTALFVEREWVPAWEQQAAARVRRMTQEESTCHKVVLSANDTIDVLFDQVVADKADLVDRIIDGSSSKESGDVANELLAKLKEGRGSLI